MPSPDDEHKTTQTYGSSGQVSSKSIQGRAFDPKGELAVQEKMKGTNLGSLASSAVPKKPERGSYSSDEMYQVALKSYERRMAQKQATKENK